MIGFDSPGALGRSPWTPKRDGNGDTNVGKGFENAVVAKVRTAESILQEKLDEAEAKLEEARGEVAAVEAKRIQEVVLLLPKDDRE